MNHAVNFLCLAKRCAALPRHSSGRIYFGEAVLEDFFGPHTRHWFLACRAWVKGGPGMDVDPVLAEMLDQVESIRPMAKLHVECARLLRECAVSSEAGDEALQRLAREAQVPVGWMRDLATEMSETAEPESNGCYLSGSQRPAARSQHLTAFLVEPQNADSAQLVGVEADLGLELVAGGSGGFYPGTELAFVSRDEFFLQAETAAKQYLESQGWWPARSDVRWHLARRDGATMSLAVGGGSLGGCFALGLVKLMAEDHEKLLGLTKLSLAGMAIKAAVKPDGTLAPVEATDLKLLKAADRRNFAQIYTVIVAEHQSVESLGLVPDALQKRILRDLRLDFHVIKAKDVMEAFILLQTDLETRWRGIDCELPPRNRDFVGRERLFAKVREFIRDHDSGCLVIRGSMGRGKSAFMAEFIHRQMDAGEAPIYHFITSEASATSDPQRIAACFYDRLRHKHRIAELNSWAELTVEQKLEQVLLLVSQKLQEEGGQEVLFLEAADQAQLNAGKSSPLGYLGKQPKGVLWVVSLRPLGNVISFGDDITVWDIDDGTDYVDDREDIGIYLRKQAATVAPPLSEEFIEAVVNQSPTPVFFTVVACLRKLRGDGAPPERQCIIRTDPGEWSRSPEELVRNEAKRRVQEAQAEGITGSEFWISLGLVALVQEPLALESLEGLGILPEPKRERVLAMCANFFRPRPALRDPKLPYVFAHPGYLREVVSCLGENLTQTCHQLLADGCRRAWRDPLNPAHRYALRHLPVHLRGAHRWEELCETLTNFAYLEKTLDAHSGKPLPGAKVGLANLPAPWTVFELLSHFQRSVQELQQIEIAGRSEVEVLYRVLDEHSHALQEDPGLLAQVAYNELLVGSKSGTQLAGQIRHAVGRYQRSWLKRLNHPVRSANPAMRKRLMGHEGQVLALAFSPREDLLASGGKDKKVRIWNANTGQCLYTFSGHADDVIGVAFLPEGNGVVSGSKDGTVRFWNWGQHRVRAQNVIRIAPRDVLAIAISPDGELLATGGSDHVVRLWKISTSALLREYRGHRAAVKALAFSPLGHQLASGSDDNHIRLWWLEDARCVALRQDTWVEALAYSPDGRTLISGGGLDRGEIRFWDTESGDCQRILPGHTAGVRCLAYSQSGRKIASGSYDRTILVRDSGTGALLPAMGQAGAIHALAFSSDGNLLASGGEDRVIKLWDVSGNPALSLVEPLRPEPSNEAESVLYAVQFSRDGKLAISGGRNQRARVWEVANALLRGTFSSHHHVINSVACSPDNQRVATGTFREVCVWATDMARLETTLQGHESWVLAVDFSPDGQQIATGSQDQKIMIWEARTGRWLRTLAGHREKVRVVAFSPDGRLLASGAEESTLKVWDPGSGQLGLALEGHDGQIVTLAFFKKGGLLASGGTDETIRIWDIQTGTLRRSIAAPGGEISALAVSPDGQLIAAGCVASTVRIWNAVSGALVASMSCADKVLALAFDDESAEGRTAPAPRILRAADAGSASHVPNFYVMEVMGPRLD